MKLAGSILFAAINIAGGLAACDAHALDAAFSGAWVGSGTSCDSTFVERKGVFSFREPVDAFALAFIISGNRLKTPGATCRIKGVRQTGDRHNLSLVCTTTIASDPIAAIFTRPAGGSLVRYSNEADKLGSTYNRCPARR